MSQSAKNPWATGDAAEKAAAETDALEAKAKTAEVETDEDEDDSPFARMMREMSGRGRDREPKLSGSELVAKLQTLGERYALPASKRFKVGDLVTPTKGLTMKGAGEPHLIVEIADSQRRSDAIDTAVLAGSNDVHAGSNAFGARMDMRVLAPGGGGSHVGCWWVESWQLEPWTPPAAKAN